MRQERAKPILEEFYAWLSKKSLQTPPKGLLGKAVSYALNQCKKLIGYLEDGRLALDNNMAENSIRPFVIGRKNWIFSGTPAGAEASAVLYSLVETAKDNNLEPYAYFKLPTFSENAQLLQTSQFGPGHISPPAFFAIPKVQCLNSAIYH